VNRLTALRVDAFLGMSWGSVGASPDVSARNAPGSSALRPLRAATQTANHGRISCRGLTGAAEQGK
ncbi:MAG: hypothetical protein WBN01_00685, partial [Polyangiales bacterium]